MRVLNRAVPTNTNYGLIKFNLPEMTAFEKKVRRIELLMLENSQGFYKSSLKAYAGSNERLDDVLKEIGAVEMGGFWIHPHYYHNVRHGHANYKVSQHSVLTEETADLVSEILNRDPSIKVHSLLRMSRMVKHQELIVILQYLAESSKDKPKQYIAAAYLYRQFGIRAVAFS